MVDMSRYGPDAARDYRPAATGEPLGAPVLLPILWSASLSHWPESIHRLPVVGGQLVVSLAELTRLPSGDIRTGHVLRAGRTDSELSRLRAAAMVSMAAGLRIEEVYLQDNIDVLRVTRADGLPVAGAITLTSFRDRISALRDWPELIVAILNPHAIYVVAAGSTGADMLSWTIAQDKEPATDGLRPSLLRVGAGGVEQLGEGGAEPGGPDADGAPRPSAGQEHSEVLLPLVRSASIKQGRDLWVMPWWDIAGDRLYATLARMSWTPRGTIGQAHVLNAQVSDDAHVAALKQEALRNASHGAGVEVMGDGERVRLLRVVREDKLPVAGILLRPDFFEWVTSIEPWPELIVGIPHGEELYIAPAGSEEADVLRQQMIPTVEHCDPDLLPSLLRVTAAGMDFLLEGGG